MREVLNDSTWLAYITCRKSATKTTLTLSSVWTSLSSISFVSFVTSAFRSVQAKSSDWRLLYDSDSSAYAVQLMPTKPRDSTLWARTAMFSDDIQTELPVSSNWSTTSSTAFTNLASHPSYQYYSRENYAIMQGHNFGLKSGGTSSEGENVAPLGTKMRLSSLVGSGVGPQPKTVLV